MNTFVGRLRSQGIDVSAWANGPLDRYAPHEHGYDKVIVCEAGSITFGLVDDGVELELTTGDRLELPAGTRHDARVGGEGVRCLEGHLPAGTLATARHLGAGSW